MLSEQSLQFVDRDQPRSPWHLDSLDQRQDAPVERRAANAERRGRLRAGVGEALDTRRLSNHFSRRCRRIAGRVAADLLASASQAAARRVQRTQR